MAETFIREPNANGDNNAWAPYLLQQTRNTLGALSAYLYNDSGTLKLAAGVIGIDDGTNKGTITNSAAKTISLTLVSVSSWAKIELSVSGTSVTISASDATAGTNPAALPTEFKNAYNATKGGFYIATTKRCIGLAWRNAAGTLEGVVNCLPFIDGWVGYSQSDDANDTPYTFRKNVEVNRLVEGTQNILESTTINRGNIIPYAYTDGSPSALTTISSGVTKTIIVKKPVSGIFISGSLVGSTNIYIDVNISGVTTTGLVTNYFNAGPTSGVVRLGFCLNPGKYTFYWAYTGGSGGIVLSVYILGVYGVDSLTTTANYIEVL